MKLDEAAALAHDVNAVRQFFKDGMLRDAAPRCSEVGCDNSRIEFMWRQIYTIDPFNALLLHLAM